jgi:hypothetical protein
VILVRKKGDTVISAAVQAMADVAKGIGTVAKEVGSAWSNPTKSGKGPGSKSGK